MAKNTFGQIRLPSTPARQRRNTQAWASDINIFEADGGLEFGDNGGLQINLDTNSGLATTSSGTTVVVQGVVGLDASGIKVNIGYLLENDGSDNLAVDADEMYNLHETWS